MKKSIYKTGDVIVFTDKCYFYDYEYNVGELIEVQDEHIGHDLESYSLIVIDNYGLLL